MTKQPNAIVMALQTILNDGFCKHTHHRAYKTLEAIKSLITADEYNTLQKHLVNTDCDNPDVYNGQGGLTQAEKHEYSLFAQSVHTLIQKYA